jgi:Ca2+-binding EF-hand superfamily protein
VFKLEEKSMDDLIEKLMASAEKMDPDQWEAALETMPQLKAKLEEDYMPDKVRFKSFRSCGQQLSKLFANLDRLRLREVKGEDVSAEINTRKKQVKKLRANGIMPSPGLSVFAQMDLDKSGTISESELSRLFKSLKHVYKKSESEILEIMKTLDSDGSGEIDELEWRRNLALCPGLLAALIADLDPDTGKLRSYRTNDHQLAKLLGNIERLEQQQAEGKDVAKELESRKTQAKRMREQGIFPAPGVVVFNQIDKDKSRSLDVSELKDLVARIGLKGKDAGDVMKLLDIDDSGMVEESEWIEGLERVQSLKIALMKNIDPDTGKLKCMD